MDSISIPAFFSFKVRFRFGGHLTHLNLSMMSPELLRLSERRLKNIPADIDIKHRRPEIEWKKISGLRDILVHEYFGIDYDVLWDIVRNKAPQLKE